MALTYQPKIGQVVMCDFSGFIEPEMVKRREVVVIARSKQNSQLVTVVPLSATHPGVVQTHHHQLSKDPRPGGVPGTTVWAKCDMVTTVCLQRLDLPYTSSRRGKRESVRVLLPPQELEVIRSCVAAALGMTHNIGSPGDGALESGSASALTQPDGPAMTS